jgi:hypothetical protein
MTERKLAILGVVAIILAALVGMIFYDQPAIGIVTGILTLGVGNILNLLKQGETSQKIDQNTNITVTAANKLGQQNAQQSTVISEVADKTATIAKAVNGDLDARFKRLEDKLNAVAEHIGMKDNKKPAS